MIQGNAFHLPFRDETFDKVICSEVMEHVHDYRRRARELARVTRPGGMLAVTIPTATSENLYLRVGDDYFESPGRPHPHLPAARAGRAAWPQAGLATIGVRLRPRAPHALLGAALHRGAARRRREPRWCGPTALFLIRATGSQAMDRARERCSTTASRRA